MITATAEFNGKPLLFIGLSAENSFRLQEDKPILIDTGAIGLPDMQVLIVGGMTEQDILDQLIKYGVALRMPTEDDG